MDRPHLKLCECFFGELAAQDSNRDVPISATLSTTEQCEAVTTIKTYGLSSASFGAVASARLDPTSSLPRKNCEDRSAIPTASGSWMCSDLTPPSTTFLAISTPRPRIPQMRTLWRAGTTSKECRSIYAAEIMTETTRNFKSIE